MIDKPVSLTRNRIFTLKNLFTYLTKGLGKLVKPCYDLAAFMRAQATFNSLSLSLSLKGPLSSTGVDGLAFVSTHLAHKEHPELDWPDIEMHMVPADVVADGGRYFKHLAGLSSNVSTNKR